MPKLLIAAPLSGWSTPLTEVPDETFARRMVGDGVAIDPVNDALHAPCDGEIIAIPASNHAITLRAACGAEILLHIGIDTVKLGGRGFTPLVRSGERVATGQPLIRFDLDVVARLAPSVLTPVLLMDGPFSITRRMEGHRIRSGDPLFEIDEHQASAAAAQPPVDKDIGEGAGEHSQRFVVHFDHGIHARPAALLVNAIKHLSANAFLAANGRKANLRSGVALMSLGARRGDEVTVTVTGPDAKAALYAIAALLSPGDTAIAAVIPVVAPNSTGAGASLRGVMASPGFAVGRAVQFGRTDIEVIEAGSGASREGARLSAALSAVREALAERVQESAGPMREVMDAHLTFIDDPELLDAAKRLISAGKSAGFAWRESLNAAIGSLGAVGDARIEERVADLKDLSTQVLMSLEGKGAGIELPERAIVLATELLPSQFAALPRERLAGICMARGGPTSHVAILAAAAGVPAIVAAGPGVLEIDSGRELILDADRSTLHASPTPDEIRAAEAIVSARHERLSAARAHAHEECRTADGVRIEVFANVGSLADARSAMEQGAEGCGLLRTEFLFLNRASPPDAEEQRAQYQAIADVFAGRPVVIRTLDAGGDKPIAYLPLPHEDNPALGLRGVRTSLYRPELLVTQLRAALAVRPAGQCRIMLPMINSVGEILAVRELLAGARDPATSESIPLGIMIETPAAALDAEKLALHADFFSIGTNDLTQYTLAMDRGSSQLAPLLDGLHPAVLRLVAMATAAASGRSRGISVCGGLASESAAIPILIGLGVRTLSMVPAAIAPAKDAIRRLRVADCRALAQRALAQESAAGVRALTGGEYP